MALSHILVSKAYDFPKPTFLRNILSRIIGDGLLIVEGDVHKRQKRIMMPAFSGKEVEGLVEVFESKAKIVSVISNLSSLF